MKRKFCLLLVFTVLLINTEAQNPMVAYLKNGIWHYYNTEGKLMWKPVKNIALYPSGWVGGLLRAEIKDSTQNLESRGKQVLFNVQGKIVFEPKFNFNYKIITGFDKSGYIQIRKEDSEILLICDKEGKIQFESSSSDARYMGDGVVAYVKDIKDAGLENDRTFVLWDIKRKKILSEIICYYFVGNYESGAIFCVNYNLYKGMINRKGKMVFPMEWDEFIYENEAHPLHTGYACLQNAVTHKWSIFNKKGKEILSNIDKEFYLGNSFFKGGFIVNNTKKIMWYSLHKKVFMDNSIYIDYYEPLSNGLIACRKTDSSIVILNKKLKKIKLIKNGGQVKAVGNHYWIQSENRKNYNCFNSKGQITATIEADDISFESYGHIPFMKDSLWGLATESGKIIINPSIREYDKYDQQVKNGYWEIRDQISSEKIYYTYYNLEGKIVLRTSAAEDGWELLRSQETYSTNYIFY